ncbi:MAG: zinc ribbon domain-containing protein [Chloroflexota bacterium]|nr:zinc ribbon domain-containing protein [Chloroflexota bacterium]
MGEPTVECYNCGRENPAWAQICRTCGVSLRGADRFASGPPPRLPTDPGSIVSMVAAVGTIVSAILVGLFLSSLDPGGAVATPPESASPSASITPPLATVTPAATAAATPAPTPVPTPSLPGQLLIGIALDPETQQVSEPQETFGPGDNFAYSLTMPAAIGTNAIYVEVARIAEDGSETVLQEPTGAQAIDGSRATAAFEVLADNLIFGSDGRTGTGDDFGTGRFMMRIYLAPNDQLVAEAPFELTAE